MKTLLTITKRAKDGRIIGRWQQPSRSFIKGMIDILYVQSQGLGGNGLGAVYAGAVGMDKETINMGIEDYNTSSARYLSGSHCGLIASGGGGGGAYYNLDNEISTFRGTVPNEHFGILVGGDNTAVTPLDARMSQIFGHGLTAAAGSDTKQASADLTITTNVTSQANSGQPNVVVASVTGLMVGMLVQVIDTTPQNAFYTIQSINAGTLTVTMTGNLTQTYTLAKSPQLKYITNDSQSTNANMYMAAPFIPRKTFRCNSVELQMYRSGAGTGSATVTIVSGRNWDINGAAILATATIAEGSMGTTGQSWVTATFGTPVDLLAGHYYNIAVTRGATGSPYLVWENYQSLPSGVTDWFGGQFWPSNGPQSYRFYGPGAWNIGGDANRQYGIRLNGRCMGELIYSGTDISNLVVSNPNASFDIRRYFKNASGANITVKETGIAAYAGYAGSDRTAILIARDVLGSPVTLSNGQYLEVVYTPSITV